MKFPEIISLIIFNGSRKVGFGLWLFAVSTILLMKTRLSSADWMICMGAASTLIGGGTVLDSWLNTKKAPVTPNAPPAA